MKLSTCVHLLICLMLFNVSCKSKKRINSDVIQINIDPKNMGDITLSDYVSGIRFVRLETNDSSLIGSISKISIYNNEIYILDDTSNKIFIFNSDGRIIRILDKIGVGPGEYIEIKDFIIADNSIYILDHNKVIKYNSKLEFENSLNYTFTSNAFVLNDNYFWLTKTPLSGSDFFLCQLDNKGKLINEFFFCDTDYQLTKWSNMLEVNNNLYFSTVLSNSISRWNNKHWDEFAKISFGNKTYTGIVTDVPEATYCVKEDFYFIGNNLFFGFAYGKQTFHCMYNMDTKDCRYGNFINDMVPERKHFFPNFKTGNFMIEYFDYDDIILYEYNEWLETIPALKNLTEYDNPILILYEFNNLGND